MYEFFEKLLASRGITAYRFCKDTGIATSTISSWKKKNSKIGMELAETISNYFDVSIDYIMTGKEADTKDNSDFDVKKEYERLRDLLKSGKMHPLYFDGIEADEESIDLLLKQVEISLAMIKKDLEKE